MNTPTLNQELLDAIIAIATEAGERIMEIYETDFAVQHKGDKSPLTAADLAAHDTILQRLAALTPELPVLSEESTSIPFSERSRWNCYWLVDPLDGTREFVKRNGEFTVNIALIDNHHSILGVVLAPVTGDCYYAAQGLGAWKQEAGGTPAAIHTRVPRPSPVRVAGSRSHGNALSLAFIDNLGETEVIAVGSSLKSCLVAEGRMDIYPRFGLTSEWDTAAAQAVVEAAGGLLTDTALRPLRYNTKDSLLNPHFLVFGDTAEPWQDYYPDDVEVPA